MSSTPTVLYRNLLRQARQMNDYNFRSYAMRRAKQGFVKNKALQGEEAVTAMNYGQEQLEILKRQVIMGQLYPSGRSVME